MPSRRDRWADGDALQATGGVIDWGDSEAPLLSTSFHNYNGRPNNTRPRGLLDEFDELAYAPDLPDRQRVPVESIMASTSQRRGQLRAPTLEGVRGLSRSHTADDLGMDKLALGQHNDGRDLLPARSMKITDRQAAYRQRTNSYTTMAPPPPASAGPSHGFYNEPTRRKPLREQQNSLLYGSAPWEANLFPSSASDIGLPSYSADSFSLSPPKPPRQPAPRPGPRPKAPAERSRPQGLVNLGNTCWLNSTLQCLFASEHFEKYLRGEAHVSDVRALKKNNADSLVLALGRLFDRMRSSRSPVKPSDVRTILVRLRPEFDGATEQDSQELVQLVFSRTHEETNRSRSKKPTATMTAEREAELGRLPGSVTAKQEWEAYRKTNDSIIVDIFTGQLRSTLACEVCHHRSVTYSPFDVLSVPVPDVGGTVTLEHCIEKFLQAERLRSGNAWHCPECKKARPTLKQLAITRTPEYLGLHLNRFANELDGTVSKIADPVDFPTGLLDLTKWVDLPDKGDTARYVLYAVNSHHGTEIETGHYTTVARYGKSWTLFNDQVVEPLEGPLRPPSSSYILWYRRTE